MTKHIVSGRRHQSLPFITTTPVHISSKNVSVSTYNVNNNNMDSFKPITSTTSVPITSVLPNSIGIPFTSIDTTVLYNTHNHNVLDTTLTATPKPWETQLQEYKILLDKITNERQLCMSQLQATETKLCDVERDNESLSRLLEETRVSLQSEKILREKEKQLMNEQIQTIRQEMIGSKEERLRKELNNVHQEEIARLRQEQEQSISYWKDLLSTEKSNRKEEFNKLQESQQRAIQSMDNETSSSNKLLTELTNQIQDTLKQINDTCSSQNQHESIEVVYEKLASRQKEYLQPLLQTMEAYLKHEKTSLSDIEASLLLEKKSMEDERTKMLLEIRKERETLEKAKEHFLSEQQVWMSDNYTEKHHMLRIQTIINETCTRNQKLETELKCLRVSLDQEQATLVLEQSKLQKQKLELEQDRTKLYHDRQTLITLEQNLQVQTLQVNRTSQIAQEVHTEGQQSLAIAHRIQKDFNKKMVEIKRREKTQQFLEGNVNSLLSSECNNELLSQIEHSQSVRDTIHQYDKDDQRLQEEQHFLQEIRIGKKFETKNIIV